MTTASDSVVVENPLDDIKILSLDLLGNELNPEEIRSWQDSFSLLKSPSYVVIENIFVLGEIIRGTKDIEVAEASLWVLKNALTFGHIKCRSGDITNWVLENMKKGFRNPNKNIRKATTENLADVGSKNINR